MAFARVTIPRTSMANPRSWSRVRSAAAAVRLTHSCPLTFIFSLPQAIQAVWNSPRLPTSFDPIPGDVSSARSARFAKKRGTM